MRIVNGYSIISAEYSTERKIWTILGAAPIGGTIDVFSYVVARMESLFDTEWFWGSYFHNDLGAALDVYNKRKKIL